MQPLQFGTGVGAEVLGEPVPDRGVVVQGVRGPAGCVQSAQVRRRQRLRQRMLTDQLAEPG